MSACKICDQLLPAEEDQVKCFGCGFFIHFSCSGLSENTYRRMSNSKKEQWRCQSCRAGQPTVTDKQPRSGKEVDIHFDTKAAFLMLNEKFDIQIETMNDLKAEIRELAKSYEALKVEVAGHAKRLLESENKIESLVLDCQNKDLKIADLANRLNKLDQYGRRINLEIHGLEEGHDEGREDLVNTLKTISNKMGIAFSESDVLGLHRLPSKKKNVIKPVIVQFRDKGIRDLWLSNRNKVKTAKDMGGAGDTSIYFNENLTVFNKFLLFSAKKRARDLGYKYVWVKNGNIYVKKSDGLVTYKIENEQDLSKIV